MAAKTRKRAVGARGALVALSTAPDVRTARRIARLLVEERLCACVNVVPAVRSIYRWKGVLHEDGELLLVLKTRRSLLAALAKRLKVLHPYDLPELVALPAVGGLDPYLAWLERETSGAKRARPTS